MGTRAQNDLQMNVDLLTPSLRHRDYSPGSTNKVWHRIRHRCGCVKGRVIKPHRRRGPLLSTISRLPMNHIHAYIPSSLLVRCTLYR